MKLGTLWLIALIGTIVLIQPHSLLAFAGYSITAALFWAWVLHQVFPEPRNLGGLPKSVREKIEGTNDKSGE